MNNKYKLVEDNIKVIYSFCNKNYYKLSKYSNIEYDDMLQDMILYILERIDKYNSNKGSISTYMYMLMYKRMIKYYSSKDILDKYSIEEYIEEEHMYDNFNLMHNHFTDLDKYTLLYIMGYSVEHISMISSKSKSFIYKSIKENIKKLKKIYTN